jgi:hypothetical protein
VIYVKSTAAGLLAAMVAYLLIVAIGVSVLIIANPKEQNSGIGFDVVAFGRSLLGRAIGVLAFVGGFFWEYLRVSRG